MTFHVRQRTLKLSEKPVLKINGVKIESVNTFKFLGITVDSELSWNSHVGEISKKLSRTCGILSRLKHILPSHILVTIYNSLFLPHIHYGITLLGFNPCSRLIILQKKAIRAITNSKYNAHTEPLFSKLETLIMLNATLIT